MVISIFLCFPFLSFHIRLRLKCPNPQWYKISMTIFCPPPQPPKWGQKRGWKDCWTGRHQGWCTVSVLLLFSMCGPHGQPGCGSKFYFLGCEVGLLVSAPATESKETVLCERVLKSLQHKANVGRWYKTSLQSHMELHANCEWCWAKRRAGEGHWVIYPSPENYRGHCRKHTNQ